MRPILVAIALSLVAVSPALAQLQPPRGTSERTVDELNRSMSRQIQTQQQNQNFQSQLDQLRSRQLQIEMQNIPTQRTGRTGIGCPAGAIGC